ncbi:MAG: phosphohistidine phosphatase SixA [Acidobacteriota bacterium]|nr:phosphohistidine phosphatase SixA [Blastocatellia bacterium]MDW8238808.1 phosphohistidine phosphatase SixA [Acidobacteriota bacterium]
MELYILRHAIAVERGTPGYRDSDRPLTPEGEKKMVQAAHGMKALGLSFDLILTSPYQRARHTAEIVATVFDAQDKLITTTALTPAGDPAELVAELSRHGKSADSILLVGHEPYLSSFISTLLVGDERLQLTMKKGGLCKLTVNSLRHGRCATLQWLLTPRQLRMLG